MASPRSLQQRTVLVVEDDFYLAEDARDALEDAGAQVLGPVPQISQALGLFEATQPDCAVLDVSVQDGPSFDLARTILSRAVPVLFVTGYDAGSIPADLARVPRLQKPVTQGGLVAAVEGLLQSAPPGARPD